MKKIIILLIAVVFLLSGCKAIIELVIDLTDLTTSKTKQLTADMYAEVTGCNDYEDSRKPSNSVIEAKKTIPDIFQGAQYVECFKKRFESFVHFKIPVILDKDKDGKPAKDGIVNIYSNDSILLGLGFPKQIDQKLEQIKKKSFGIGGIDDLIVKIKIKNNTGTDFPFRVISSYIDDEPYVYGEMNSPKGSSFTVKLSDVTVDQALKKSYSQVLFHPLKK